MLPWLIYKDLLHGRVSTQQASQQVSLPVHSTGQADSIYEVHLVPHANGDLSPNGAGARSGEARSQPAVLINFGSGGLYAHQGWDVPSLRAHMCGQTLQVDTTPQSAAQGYMSNMMQQLTITRGGKTSDRPILHSQCKWFGCTSAQS